MGRRYRSELDQLGDTYSWAMSVDIGSLAGAVSSFGALPLLTVGSGGSLSAAYHASTLHQEHSGLVSRPFTPLELIRSSVYLGSHGVLFLSAGGTNADIIGSFRNTIERDPRRCSVLCFRRGSALSGLAAQHDFVHLVEMAPPTAKDGFLSTNSLLAFAVLLERAYAHVFGTGETLPVRLEDLVPSAGPVSELTQRIRDQCRSLWQRDTILVLHGTPIHAAAVDLESKFSEAALGHVQVADFRNFAHGRHNWVAKRGDTTGVLALYSEPDRELADATLELLPKGVPVARVHVPVAGAPSRIGALVAVLHLVGAAGEARGIDPGRPLVPPFGRQIYHLQAFSKSRSPRLSDETVAIARKLAMDPHHLNDRAGLDGWRRAYREYVAGLGDATFRAILFDYDGTLCDARDRFTGLRKEVASALRRIIEANVPVGIATGRGKSVRESLRKALPEKAWSSVFVGYYNCTDIARLQDDAHPNASGEPLGSLGRAAKALARHPVIASLATAEVRPTQVSIQPRSSAASDLVWRVVLDFVQAFADLKVVRSSHSVDILMQAASKRALLKTLSEFAASKQVLTIGDMGHWPGNDHDILATPYSLSVDEVSTATSSCWNLAPAGFRGVQAVLHYMDCVIVGRGSFTFDVARLTGKPSTKDRP